MNPIKFWLLLVFMELSTNGFAQGIAFNHPEPLRVWPETQNGRGDVFVNYSPTKNKDWLLNPGQTYTLRYRLLVYNGRYTREQAETSWQYFSKPPTVSVKHK